MTRGYEIVTSVCKTAYFMKTLMLLLRTYSAFETTIFTIFASPLKGEIYDCRNLIAESPPTPQKRKKREDFNTSLSTIIEFE